ncbi:uncharacterized protein G2W53_012971 [Senna tora]|uniref:Uncharacterized protein n=1 Tax=Senna tora TaxID=362788 RepID=A0A834TXN8_9FABA|nr:uncharacterized protein G2W53_012971 [Senna tora]
MAASQTVSFWPPSPIIRDLWPHTHMTLPLNDILPPVSFTFRLQS